MWFSRDKQKVASDPTTSPDILQEFAAPDQSQTIRRLVASNPNTPTDELVRLAAEFPYEVAENPMFTLLLLENPLFISQLEQSKLMAILTHRTELPTIFLDQAVQHESAAIHQVLLKQFQLSEQNLERCLERISNVTIARELIKQKNCTDRLKLIAAKSGNQHLQRALAEVCLNQAPILPIDLLEVLIDHATIDIQIDMTIHPRITEALLDRLFASDRTELHLRLAQKGKRNFPHQVRTYSESLSESIQLRLVRNQLNDRTAQILVRQELVRQPWITTTVLGLLSYDPYERVRSQIAKLPNLSLEMRLRLAEDKSDVVQNSLVRNRSIDSEALSEMSTHPNIRVRQLVARHPNTPIEILKELAQEVALQPLIIRHRNIPIALLRELATSGKHDIALTQTPKTPDHILQPILARLAIAPSYTIRKLVARHPATTKALLLELAHDPEVKVSRIAQARLAILK
jgi:hypothetical protein